MVRWVVGGLLLAAVVSWGAWLGYSIYTVGGTRLRPEQVQKVAYRDGGQRLESASRVVIDEALDALRYGPARAHLRLVRSGTCRYEEVGFLTEAGWRWEKVYCPDLWLAGGRR